MNGAWIAEIGVGARQPVALCHHERGDVRGRRADVRDADRPRGARHRQGDASRRAARRCSTRSASAATAGRSPTAKSKARTMGDVVVRRRARAADRARSPTVNPELRALALGDLKPISWKSFDGMEIWGLLLTPPGYEGKTRVPSAGLLPRRTDRRRDARNLSAVHARARTDRSVSDRSVRQRGLRGPVPDAARRIGLRRSRSPDDHQRLGRARLQGHHGGRRSPDCRAASPIPIASGVMGASYGGFMTNWIVTQTGALQGRDQRARASPT